MNPDTADKWLYCPSAPNWAEEAATNAPETRMNPDTADLIHDMEETAAFQYSSRVEAKTDDILEDLDLLNDALGDFSDEYGLTVLSMIIQRSHRSAMSLYQMTQTVDALNLQAKSIAEWYAKRLIKAKDQIDARHPIPRREAD